MTILHWRHNDHDDVSNHQPHGCLLNRLSGRRSKKTSKLRVTGLCAGNSPGSVSSPHKWPVTRKMFPFDDVIMNYGQKSHFGTRWRTNVQRPQRRLLWRLIYRWLSATPVREQWSYRSVKLSHRYFLWHPPQFWSDKQSTALLLRPIT